MNRLWDNDEFARPVEDTPANRRELPDQDVPSHLTLELDEDGEPVLARMTYVDESTCIGCKNCALVARNTFFMEESFAGKARVFNQGGDSEDLIAEAIESCPVDCIHYVSVEDLRTLEQERLARDENMDFNNYADFKRAWTGQDAAVPETKAKYYGSLAMGNRCNNCPSRGCAQCPMFGVGENPIYLKRKQARELKKQQSGEAERERRDREAQRRIDVLYGEGGAAGADGAAAVGTNGEALDSVFDAIFGDGYADPAGGDLIYGDAESAAKERLREELGNDEAIAESLDPYAVLGVKEDASLKEIKRAFRRLAMRWHPDRNARLPEIERLQAELIFKQVNFANEVLTDAAKRRLYDSGKRDKLKDMLGGFWERLAARMDGGNRRSAQNELDGAKGVVKPVALGSGVSLSELADEEEKDSGIKAPLLLSAVSSGPGEEDDDEEEPEDDGRDPNVKYDYWGRPMA